MLGPCRFFYLFFLMILPPSRSTLFPYTTLFRSHGRRQEGPEASQGHGDGLRREPPDRKSTRLNSSHRCISYAVFCLKKKNKQQLFNVRIDLDVDAPTTPVYDVHGMPDLVSKPKP